MVRQLMLGRRYASKLQFVKTITKQTGSNKAECTVNSRVQKDQILGVKSDPCRRQLYNPWV